MDWEILPEWDWESWPPAELSAMFDRRVVAPDAGTWPEALRSLARIRQEADDLARPVGTWHGYDDAIPLHPATRGILERERTLLTGIEANLIRPLEQSAAKSGRTLDHTGGTNGAGGTALADLIREVEQVAFLWDTCRAHYRIVLNAIEQGVLFTGGRDGAARVGTTPLSQPTVAASAAGGAATSECADRSWQSRTGYNTGS